MVDIKNKTTEGRNEYTYSASGQKLRAVQRWNPNYNTAPVIGSDINVSSLTNSTTTDYVGNIIYEDGNLKRILIDGGYIERDNYYFYINDHLGNNRIVANAAASVVQSTQYYPFGSSFADASGTSTQPYKYNGKELDAKNGLNMYDYSARHLALDVPKFTTVDPLAEKYYSISPYTYVANNPLKFIDPTGMSYTYNWDTNEYENGDGDPVPFSEVLDWIRNKSNRVTNTVISAGNYISEKAMGVTEQATSAVQDFTLTVNFITGAGPNHYEFGMNNYSTKSLKESYLTTTALELFMDQHNKDLTRNSFTFDVGFSPFKDAKAGPFNSVLKDKGYSTAQFVGSCSYKFEIKGSQIEITVSNVTSLNSALYHIPFIGKPSRDDTPFGFGGNISQNYHFTMSMNEIQQRIAKK